MSVVDCGDSQPASGLLANLQELGLKAPQQYVRGFPISKGKGRLASLLRKPLSRGVSQRQTLLRQADVRVLCDLRKSIQRRLYFWGAYEEAGRAHWIRRARQSRVTFDVGANVVLYTLLAAWANPESEVHTFEPTPETMAVLKGNIAMNSMQSITVESLAVGDFQRTGYLRLCADSDGSNEEHHWPQR